LVCSPSIQLSEHTSGTPGPKYPTPGNYAANGLLQHHGRLSSDPR
jgi:hypothetical protein